MPRMAPFKKAMKEYLEHCYLRGLTEGTIRSYESALKRIYKVLGEGNINPRKIDQRQLAIVLRAYRGKPDTIRKFRIFLKFNDNHIAFPKIPYSEPRRTWLTKEEEELLRASNLRPIEKMILTLGLDHGFRRIEMSRALKRHFEGRHILIIGKGTFGGKKRYLKLTNYMKWILNDYLPERQALIDRATNTSDHLLIYLKAERVYPYTPDGISCIIWRLSKNLEIPFASHTLRRTFARSLWEEGASIETIRDILGHSKLDETEKYIGTSIDRMDTALVEYHKKCSQMKLPVNLKKN